MYYNDTVSTKYLVGTWIEKYINIITFLTILEVLNDR